MVNSSVQHVTKKSSDELLRKFAEVGAVAVVKPRRRRGRIVRENIEQCESPVGGVGGGGVVERRRLIPAAGRNKFGIGNGRSQPLRVRDFRNKSILGAIQKVNFSFSFNFNFNLKFPHFFLCYFS